MGDNSPQGLFLGVVAAHQRVVKVSPSVVRVLYGIRVAQLYRSQGGCVLAQLRTPTVVDMSVLLFELAVYALVALACAASFAVLRHWLRQRVLQKIPGPSNPSLFWGKTCQLRKTGHMLRGLSRSLASHGQSLCIFVL
jgi:hypothetical protein